MAEKRILVELTTADAEFSEFFPPHQDLFHALKAAGLGRLVVIEGENEFLDDESRILVSCEILTEAKEQGFITSGGAWGYSNHGKELAERFDEECSAHDALVIHRGPYPPKDPWLEYIRDRKKERPVNCNELLYNLDNIPSVPVGELEDYIRGAKNAGANAICVYRDEWKLAGCLCQEFNQ